MVAHCFINRPSHPAIMDAAQVGLSCARPAGAHAYAQVILVFSVHVLLLRCARSA